MSDLPSWVPEGARHYLAHTEGGLPIRALARRAKIHASTVLRQVRRFETRRDDPLIDDALRALSDRLRSEAGVPQGEREQMKRIPAPEIGDEAALSEELIDREALRILRRLSEAGAVLAVARDMERGVVVRDGPGGAAQRTAVVARDIAQAMALKDWIACADPAARIVRYHITGAGRTALKRLMAQAENRASGFSEAQAAFAGPGEGGMRLFRSAPADSPLAGLARRRDKDGKPFLSRDLVAAGERLREDFEMAQAGPRVAQDWDRFLTAGVRTSPGDGGARGAEGAKERVAAALAELGPGLGDVALRCCCYLEGMESLEERMGWSARSGKIVLRIALQRLRRHYEAQGARAQMIG